MEERHENMRRGKKDIHARNIEVDIVPRVILLNMALIILMPHVKGLRTRVD